MSATKQRIKSKKWYIAVHHPNWYTSCMATSTGGVPPGFRFHPTEEELLHYYLKRKVSFQKFDMEVIREVDLNKMEPWELQGKYYLIEP